MFPVCFGQPSEHEEARQKKLWMRLQVENQCARSLGGSACRPRDTPAARTDGGRRGGAKTTRRLCDTRPSWRTRGFPRLQRRSSRRARRTGTALDPEPRLEKVDPERGYSAPHLDAFGTRSCQLDDGRTPRKEAWRFGLADSGDKIAIMQSDCG